MQHVMHGGQRLEEEPPGLKLFDRAAFASTQFPRLTAVFERMATASLESLREVCTVPPHYVFKDVQNETLGTVLESVGEGGMAAIFAVPEWEGQILFVVDRAFVYALTELVYGGDGSEPPYEEGRSYSLIEKNVVRAVLSTAAQALQTSLSRPGRALTIAFERMETDMEAIDTDDGHSEAVVSEFDFQALGRTGAMHLVIPRSTVRTARARRSVAANGKSAAADVWSRRMQEEIRSTTVPLNAILEERSMTLAEIAGFKVGQLIPLDARVDGRIKVECNGEPMFTCQVGKSEGAYTLRVDQVLKRQGRSGS